MRQDIEYLLKKGPEVVFEGINKVQNKIAKVIDETLNVEIKKCSPKAKRVPAADFYEKSGNYIIDVLLPGIDVNDIEISCQTDKLTVAGVRKSAEKADAEKKGHDKAELEDIHYINREISYGVLERTFTLPVAKVDDSKIKASFKDGILSITVPKTKEPKAKKIKIDTEKK